ncbi:hypothetical protein RCO48_27855 [Peribacillus frigoritolerans]|nr:hypothetical protein [Peribacillus frigoritolerans]
MKKVMDSIPVKSPKVYEIIFNQIKESFISGELKPGDKLPLNASYPTVLK